MGRPAKVMSKMKRTRIRKNHKGKNTNVNKTMTLSWIVLGIILLLAFFLRFTFAKKAAMMPFNFLSDSSQYVNWARKICEGKESISVFHQSPLYPYFLAGIFLLFGNSIFSALVVHAILGALTCFFLYCLSLKVFKNKKVGILSAFILAAYGPAIFYNGMLLMATLVTFLDVLLLFSLMKAVDSNKAGLWAISGIILGGSAISRGSVLLFLPLLFLFLLWNALIEYGKGGHFLRTIFMNSFLIPALLLAIGAFLVILPVTLRNYVRGKDFVLIAANGGITFYSGNNPGATGRYMDPPGLDLAEDFNGGKIASHIEKRHLRPSEISRFWFHRSWEFIKNNPRHYLKLLLIKFVYFWNYYEIPNAENYYFAKKYSKIFNLPLVSFLLIGTLGLLGIVISFIKKEGNKSIVLLFLLSHMLGVILFFITSRYRLPVVPVLIVFSAYAILAIYEEIKSKKKVNILIFTVIGVLCLSFIVFPWKGLDRRRDYAYAYLNVGILFHLTKDLKKAIRYYQSAMDYDPSFVLAYNNLGGAYYELGQKQEAIKYWQSGLTIDPNSPMIHMNMGNMYLKEGDVQKAKEEYVIASPRIPYSIKMQNIKKFLNINHH